MQIQTRVSVTGFSQAEVEQGLSDLLDEIQHRPWLLNPNASWQTQNNALIINVITADLTPTLATAFVLDELGDCVIATLNFGSDGIHFEVIDSKRIDEVNVND